MIKRTLITIILFLAALALASPVAWADSITKTYLFSGSMSGGECQGYFYEEGKDARYNCFSDTPSWTYGSTASIHATLADGITIDIASSSNQIFVQNGLAVSGNVTVTVGGGTNNRYILHVELHNEAQAVINANPESTHSFSTTISTGIFYKLVITYSDKDIYLINESSTIIRGVNEKYEYTGSPIQPEPTEVVCNGTTLTKGTHYDVSYANNTDPGTATVTVTGKSPYHGSVSKEFDIYDPRTVPWEWSGTVRVTEDKTTLQPVHVMGNVNLEIADGVTLTAKSGITIAGSATLTMVGPGSLTVTIGKGEKGTNGANGGETNNGDTGGPGSTGSAAISGSLIINDGTVNVTGGTGGEGGAGGGTSGYQHICGTGGNGGTGGAGIDGSLIVNGGIVNITGGTGGAGGYGGSSGFVRAGAGTGGDGGLGGLSITGSLTVTGGTVNTVGGAGGAGGKGGTSGTLFDLSEGLPGKAGMYNRALVRAVTCTAANYVIRESNNYYLWNDLASGSLSEKRFVLVFEISTLSVTAQKGTFAGQTRYWATFYHPSLSFQLPADAQAFTMGSGNALYRVGDGSIIPAGCAVIIMVESSSTNDSIGITLTKTISSMSVGSNKLQGTSTATAAPSGAHVLSMDSSGNVGFFPFTGTIPANKAYYVE